MTGFDEWNLHDAPLESIEVRWADRVVVVRLAVFMNPGSGQNAVDCEMRFCGCTKLVVPHEAPWGDSIFVNEHGQDGQSYWMLMQSGDVLEVWADGVELVELDPPVVEDGSAPQGS